MKTIKTTLIVFFAMSLSMALQAKKVELRYHLEKGAEINFEFITTQEISQEVMGQPQGTNSVLTQKISFKVLDILSDGNYLMQRNTTGMKIKMASPIGDMEYDSDTEMEESAFSGFSWLLKTPVEFIMTPKGMIVEVKDAEKLAETFAEKMGNGGMESQMAAGLVSQFSNAEAIKQNVGTMLLNFPDKKMKKGQNWEFSSTMDQMVNFKSTAITTLSEVNAETAVLVQEVKIEVGENGGKMEMEGMEMEYDLTGGKQGSYDLDLKTGCISKGEGITTISGVISIDSPQLPAPMSIPMSIKTTETITRIQ